MKRFASTRGMIVFLLLVCMLAGYYFYLSNKTEKDEEVDATKVQEVLLRDLSRNYPATPKEVVRYYSEIMQCLYNEEYTEEELEQLAEKVLEIYDSDLVAFQSEEYINKLRDDVTDYKTRGVSVSSFKTSNSTDVEYFTKDGRQCAGIFCTYTLRLGSSLEAVEEVFILRKDEEGHWKIFGWDDAKGLQQPAAS